MTIASAGTLGTAASSTSAASFTLATATNTLAAGDFALLTVASDNRSLSDGATSDHTAVAGGAGTWTKLGEWTNAGGGTSAAGACVSLWLFEASGSVAVGTVLTISLSGAVTDKCASLWKFTKAAGAKLRLASGGTNPVGTVTSGSTGFGSAALSGLAAGSRLYFRGLAKEANSATQITPTAGFTAIANTRSRNNTAAIGAWGEHKIASSAGETSNPTLAVSGDTAGLFAAVEEYTPVLASSLTDDFEDGATGAQWTVAPFFGSNVAGGSGAEQNGRIELTTGAPANSAIGYVSADSYYLDAIHGHFPNASIIAGTGSRTIYLAFGPDANNNYFAWFNGGGLYLEKFVGGARSLLVTSAGFNHTVHKWWRLRWGGPSDNTVYIDIAPDSASDPPAPGEWTQAASSGRDPAVDLTNGKIAVGVQTDNGTAATLYVDCINGPTVAAAGGVSGTAAGAVAFTGSATAKVRAAGTAAATFAFSGTGAGKVKIAALASPALALTAAASGKTQIRASAGGVLALAGGASGKTKITALANGTIALTGAAGSTSATGAHAAGTVPLGGTANASVRLSGAISGPLALSGTAGARNRVSALGGGLVAITGASAGMAAFAGVRGSAAGALGFVGTAAAKVKVRAAGNDNLALAGSSGASVRLRLSGAGALGFDGTAAGMLQARAPLTYPLAGVAQAYPGDAAQAYPLAGSVQRYPHAA